MLEPAALRLLRSGAGHVYECYPMMLLIVGDEGDEIVSVREPSAQEGDVEVYHGFEVGRAQDDVSQCRWTDHFVGDGVIIVGTIGDHIVGRCSMLQHYVGLVWSSWAQKEAKFKDGVNRILTRLRDTTHKVGGLIWL